MARFIELHETIRDNEPIFVNIDTIAFVSPDEDIDGCSIVFCCTHLSSNQRTSSMMEVKHVVESYQKVKELINEWFGILYPNWGG